MTHMVAAVFRIGIGSDLRFLRIFVLVFATLLFSGNAENVPLHFNDIQRAVLVPSRNRSLAAPIDHAITKVDERCAGTSKPWLSCDAISAQAALDQAQDSHRQATVIWWQFAVGFLTLVAAAAAAAFGWQAAHHTRRSANIAESALKYIERPVIQIEIERFVLGEVDHNGLPILTYKIKNHGRTPALILSTVCILSVVDFGQSPPKVNAESRLVAGNRGVIIGSGEKSEEIRCGQFNAAPGVDMSDLFGVGRSTFLVGYIWYKSMSSPEYVRGFLLEFSPLFGKFVFPQWSTSEGNLFEYNYDHELDA